MAGLGTGAVLAVVGAVLCVLGLLLASNVWGENKSLKGEGW